MKLIIQRIFLILLLSSLSGISCTVVDSELLELVLEIKNQNQELLEEVKSLQSKSDSLVTELKKSAAKQEEVLKKVTDLQAELAKVVSQIGKLSEQLTSQDADLEAIKSQLADLQKKYEGILKQLEQLQKLSQILAEIEKLKGQLTELDGKYQVIQGSLAQNKEQLDALKGQVAALQALLAENINKISQLTSQLGAQGADIEKILAAIEELKKSCAEIKALLENQLSGKSPIPTNGLVGWWPFNGNANDESGSGRNGIVNGATLTTDRFGNTNSSYHFKGTTNEITLSNSNNLVNGSFSVSAWCTIETLSPSNFDATLIGQFNGQLASERKWLFGYRSISTQRGISYYLCDNSGNYSQTNFATFNWAPQASIWYHITWVFTSGNSIKIYVNGVIHSNVSLSLTSFNNTANTVLTKIGNAVDVDSPAKVPWNGKIDDVAIWNRALTVDEVSKIHKGEGF